VLEPLQQKSLNPFKKSFFCQKTVEKWVVARHSRDLERICSSHQARRKTGLFCKFQKAISAHLKEFKSSLAYLYRPFDLY
jgi:hypothetical protein